MRAAKKAAPKKAAPAKKAAPKKAAPAKKAAPGKFHGGEPGDFDGL